MTQVYTPGLPRAARVDSQGPWDVWGVRNWTDDLNYTK